jgi:predicted peptidase
VPFCGGWGRQKNVSLLKICLFGFSWGKRSDRSCPEFAFLGSILERVGNQSIHYTEYPDVGHEAWETAYQSEELFRWLFSQKKE